MAFQIEDIDHGWASILGSLEMANGKRTKVGVCGEAARRREPSGLTVARVAAVHEYGSDEARVPERAFIRSAIDSNSDELLDELGLIAGQIFDDEKVDPKRELSRIGALATEMIRSGIRSGLEPPLAESTIESKLEHGDSETRPLAGWLADNQGHEESDSDEGDEGDGQ